MLPEQWLRTSIVVKARNKLPTWSRDDFMAFAQAEYGSLDLSKLEVSKLVEKLKHPDITKPPSEFVNQVKAKDMSQSASVDFPIWKTNGTAKRYDETHWYFSEGRAELRFSSDDSVINWAINLLDSYSKDSWPKIIKTWRESNKLDTFDPGCYNAKINTDLQKILDRRNRINKKAEVILPDNAAAAKQYWGTKVGDIWHNDEYYLVAKSIRANTDSPPTVTFEKILKTEEN